MEKMVGYCGIICSDCPVFIATRENDDAERRHVSEIFTRQYGTEYKQVDINCDGCPSDSSRIFNYCNVCNVRKCGKEKQVENCACCGDYPCEKLSKVFAEYSKAKETLDNIKSQL
ncbi:DUF3795 domain-containing protein [Candidatus Bathyarchaeota archaeon]|nr:DUF3795 domain-containing protein [Candidatus Bathyarchaeota archaeon]